MELSVFLIVLFAAVLHASWNALIKSSGDRIISMALHDVVMFTICITLFFFFTPPINAEAIPYFLSSAAVLAFYRVFILKAYRYGDFSRSYPISRGVAPLLVACAGIVIGDDLLSGAGYGGILLMSIGITSLVFSKKYGSGPRLDRGFFYALGTGIIIASYSVIDSRGVQVSGSSLAYLACLISISSSWMPVYALATRRKQFISAIPVYGPRALISGSCAILAYVCIVWAYSHTSPVQVVALRETSVIFGAFIGSYILKEGLGPRRIGSAILVVIGIYCLQSFG